MTELDQALQKFIQDEEQQDQYYDLILKTDFYIPLDTEGSETPLDGQESVTPLILKSADKHYILLFDSEERLSNWSKKPVNYVVMAGYGIAAISTPDLHWAINVGSEFAKEFVPDEINWLKENLPETKE